MVLKFHQYFTTLPVPDKLTDSIFTEKGESLNKIGKLSKINVFVGPNNSGKSLLIREILKEKEFSPQLDTNLLNPINKHIDECKTALKNIFNEKQWACLLGNNNRLDDLIIDNVLNEYDGSKRIENHVKNMVDVLKATKEKGFHTFQLKRGDSHHFRPNQNKDIIKALDNTIQQLTTALERFFLPSFAKIYSPTIRSLRKYGGNETLLSKKTVAEYSFSGDIIVENGQNLYSDLHNILTSGFDMRRRKVEFEAFLSEYFFENQKIELTPHQEKNELTLKIGLEAERPIYDLGDGLQMIICLTFPLFQYDRGIIVIEEPEIFMHPGLLKKLIETFLNHEKSNNFLFLIASHSNHILDMANYSNNISVFSVRKILPEGTSNNKEANFSLNQLSQGDDSALKLLGVANTSVYLANSTIWLEGITDVLYFRKYFEAYLTNPKIKPKYVECREYQEGVHYAFVTSAGNNITHFDFSDSPRIEDLKKRIAVRKLCGKAFVLVDEDNAKNKGLKEKFFKELGGRFRVLPVIEVENLLPIDVIIETVKDFPTCSDLAISDRRMDKIPEHKNIRLGTFIDKHLLKGIDTKSRKKFSVNSKSSQSKTLNCKLDFCNKAINHITPDNMTKETKKVVEAMLDFIIEQN